MVRVCVFVSLPFILENSHPAVKSRIAALRNAETGANTDRGHAFFEETRAFPRCNCIRRYICTLLFAFAANPPPFPRALKESLIALYHVKVHLKIHTRTTSKAQTQQSFMKTLAVDSLKSKFAPNKSNKAKLNISMNVVS